MYVITLSLSLSLSVWRKNTAKSGKGKAIPLQACTDPEGSRRLRRPDFKIFGT